MTPKERMMAALRGETPDRVPLELAGFQFASTEQVEALQDPLRRQISERIFDQSHYTVDIPSGINRMLVTPPQRIRHDRRQLPDRRVRITTRIDTPKGELSCETVFDPTSRTTWHVDYPVKTLADIEAIASVPWELPPSLDSVSLPKLPPDFHERGILETRLSSPMVCVAGMMNYQWFLELSLTEPALIAELTDICRRRILDCVARLAVIPELEYAWLGGSEWVTPPMGSPSLYDALVQEQEREIIQRLKVHHDIFVHVHCHGHVRHALQRCIERGADYTEPVEPPPDGDLTMSAAKALAAGRITLGGNIECRILCNGSEEAVSEAVTAAFEGGRERFVLRPTEGPSPVLTQQEFRNYMRLVDLWEELSPVP